MLTACPSPESDQSISCPPPSIPLFLKIHFNIILPSTSWSLKWLWHISRAVWLKRNVYRIFCEGNLLKWPLELQRREADVKSEYYMLIVRNGNRSKWLTYLSNSWHHINCHDTSDLRRPCCIVDTQFFMVFFAFLHVLYVSHKLNLLMISSRLS